MRIRRARSEDAEAAAALIRRSIAELCVDDHGNAPARLDPWLANKTPETVRKWLASPDSIIALAVMDDAIAGVGGCLRDGSITLNYVHPDKRYSGVSTAMLSWLEDELRRIGIGTAELESTRTAHDFYRARGYADTLAHSADGEPVLKMTKRL